MPRKKFSYWGLDEYDEKESILRQFITHYLLGSADVFKDVGSIVDGVIDVLEQESLTKDQSATLELFIEISDRIKDEIIEEEDENL